MGVTDFFLPRQDFVKLLEHALGRGLRAEVRLNRPHLGHSFLHRIDWDGRRFIHVSVRPLVVL